MNNFETMTIDTTDFNTKHLSARTRSKPASSGDHFAAAAAGLGSTRDIFYSSTGRSPNVNTDDTRRTRALKGGSGNRHLSALDLWTEREISRHIRENSEVFEGMIATWSAEVIQCGFTLTPVSGIDSVDRKVKEALFGWDNDGGWFADCDARGLLHFWELIELAEQTELTDGDHAFALDPMGNDKRGTVAIIEGDRILTPSGYMQPAGREIYNGIECDKRTGRPVRVFVANEAPQHCHCSIENGRMFPVFDKKNPAAGGILLSMSPKRYSASRRQPWLSTAVRGHDELEDVLVATRIALRNQACRSTYTKIDDWEAYSSWLTQVDPEAITLAAEEALEHSPNPGDHVYSNPGEEVGVLDATQPGNNFEPFMKLNLRMIGLPLGMGLEESVKIFDRNFSASRLLLQGTRRRYKKRQKTIKRSKVSPIIDFAIARLQAVDELPTKHRTINRIGCKYPVWPYIEPLKDAKADRELRDMKAKSSRTISEERGYQYEQEAAELASEGPLDPMPTAPITIPPESDDE